MSWSSVCWELEHSPWLDVGQNSSAGKLEVTTRKRRAVRGGKLNAGGKKLARMVSGGQEESSRTTKRNFEGTRTTTKPHQVQQDSGSHIEGDEES